MINNAAAMVLLADIDTYTSHFVMGCVVPGIEAQQYVSVRLSGTQTFNSKSFTHTNDMAGSVHACVSRKDPTCPA